MSERFREFSTVLVANRGEIARRVIAAAKLRGLSTVAVHSDADAGAPFVREADCAVRLPGDAPTETYLDTGRILDAAARAGADAVHPGYGFLSENAAFARAVIDAGLTWIGPSPEAIDAMGSKTRAKEMMVAAGVPALGDLDVDEVTEDMLPVLVKASAGGGGRGMRVVRDLDALRSERDAAAAEARGAFGDGTVFVERYIESGRHIEVQLMADAHGTVWAVGERECSVQRRHQKVIEEAPSPLVERVEGMRGRLFDAARAAAAAIGYVGAGTVEFLADHDGEFFFLEMNTRLQVEHPVTEATTGLDLVGLQFDVAAGRPLPSPEPPGHSGWAVEARLYAEDPAQDYRPMSGELTRMDVDGVVSRFTGPHLPGIRLDSGIEAAPGEPAEVGVHYDAMLAKIISFAPNRREAIGRLSAALRGARIHGMGTNRDLLARILDDADFRSGEYDTGFLSGARMEELSAPLADGRCVELSAFAAAVAAEEVAAVGMPAPAVPAGFRNVGAALTTHRFTGPGGEVAVAVRRAGGVAQLATAPARAGEEDGAAAPGAAGGAGGEEREVRVLAVRRGPAPVPADAAPGGAGPVAVTLDDGGVSRTFTVERHGASVGVDSPLGPVNLTALPRYDDPSDVAAAGSLLAPMPGTIIDVRVSVGDEVTVDQVLLTMEAMKMEHVIRAGADGTVTALSVGVGDTISTGAPLAVVEEA